MIPEGVGTLLEGLPQLAAIVVALNVWRIRQLEVALTDERKSRTAAQEKADDRADQTAALVAELRGLVVGLGDALEDIRGIVGHMVRIRLENDRGENVLSR